MSITQTHESPRTYGTAKGWRIFIYLFLPPLILLFFSSPFWLSGEGGWDGPRLGLLAGAWVFGLFFCYALYETIKGRHLITEQALIYQGAFQRKELPLDAVLGYRIDRQYTHVLPKSAAHPKIRISHTSEGYEEIQQWLAARYPDMDAVEQEQAAAQLLEDHTLGRTVAEREATVAQTRKVTQALNLAGTATGAWLFFLPKPYEWAFAAGLVLPLLGAAALFWHRGVARPDEQKNSAYPSLVGALLLPSLGLLLRGIADFELLTYAPLWRVAGLVAGLFGTVLLLSSKEFLWRPATRWSVLLWVAVEALVYGYSAPLALNCAFDEGTPQVYEAQVLSKRRTSGKTTTYYLRLGPWGPRTEAEDVTVTEEQYLQTATGSTMHVYRMPGRLGIPWFVALE